MNKFTYKKIRENVHLLVLDGDRETLNVQILYSAGGSWFESKQDLGKKHLLEHCIVSRTKALNHEEFKSWERKNSISMNAFTGPLTMGLDARGHKSDLNLIIETLSECCFNPTFDVADLNREKEIVLKEIDERRGDPAYVLYFDTIKQIHPEGDIATHETLGDKEMVSQTTIEDFIRLNKENLTSGHIVYTIDGKVDNIDEIIKIIEKNIDTPPYFFKEPSLDSINSSKALPINYRPETTLKPFNILGYYHPLAHEHCEITIYLPVKITSKNLAARSIFNNLYLQYGGILYDRLREEKMLVYGISSYWESDLNRLSITLTCSQELIEKVLEETADIFSSFEKYFDEQKLFDYLSVVYKKQAIAKDNLNSTLTFSLNMLLRYNEIIQMDEYIEQLKLVTKDDIKNLFNEISDNYDKKQILLVSKNKEIEKFTK